MINIRDAIHGAIEIEKHELPVLDSYFFQRLREIKQTGFAEHSFPGATHTRYIHSLGATHTITQIFQSIFSPNKLKLPAEAYKRFRALARFSAMLHDIGHGPLSHTTEFAMPEVHKLKVPGAKKSNRKASHEDYTLKILLDSPLTPILEKATAHFGFTPLHIAAAIESHIEVNDDFFFEKVDGQTIDFRPILHQLISSELDADRMDYLRRDSYQCGVNYGVFEYDWILSNLTFHINENDSKCYLALGHRGLYAFEDFLLSRYHMFLMVYLHHKTVVFDEMLSNFLNDPTCDYHLPADIEQYAHCTDSHLYSHLSNSQNQWAKRIVEKRPYRMLLETHSGIPNTEKAREQQERLFKKLKNDLEDRNIPFIANTSVSELSKYFGKSDHTIYVRYDNLFSEPSFIPLQKCTSLFTQYPNTRAVSRLYVDEHDYIQIRKDGKGSALDFD
jgi:HD superfamily phosphohydrolase